MIPRLLCLLFCWDFAVNVGHAQKLLGVKKASLKVQINATSDTVNLKFLRPSPNINLEGFILGYGSNFFSTQYIPLPENGKFYDTELDAEPRYLIAVHPSPVVNSKKNCAGKAKVQKPLQVVVGTLTPTSVYLAWGVLVNPQYDWTVLNKCLTDRFYTVRYREKEKNKKWLFHLCPNTETVIDNLKPNVIYEFGVKDNSEDGIWNKGVTHKTTVPPKHKINGGNGHIQNTYSAPKGHIQVTPEDTKMFIPITMIKQVVQNISIPKKDKSVKASVPPAKIAAVESLPGTKRPALPIVSKKSEAFPVYSESQTERSEYAPSPGLSLSTPAVNDTQRIPAIPGTFEKPVAPQTGTAKDEMTQQPLTAKTYISTEEPESTLVSNELPIFTPMEKTTEGTKIQIINPEKPNRTQEIVKTKTTTTTEHPKPTQDFFLYPEPSEVSEIQESRPAPQGMMPESLKTRAFIPTEKTGTTEAVHETTQETPTDITDISPKQPDSTPVSNEPTISSFKEDTSAAAEIQELKPAVHQIAQEYPTDIPDISPKQPNSTMVSNEPTILTFKEDTSAAAEIQELKPESTRQNIPETITPKSSRNEEQPKATLAFFETPYSSLEPKDLEMPEIPQTNPVHRTSPKPATTKPTRVPRKPSKATHGSKEPPFIPFKDSTSEWPHRPQSTPVPTKIQKDSSSKTKTSKGPHWELAPNEIHKFSSAQPKTTQITKGPLTTPAPKKTQRMPINFIRLRIFGDPDMTSAANDMYKFPSAKPKTTQTTERLLPTHASKKTQRVPINLIRFQIFGGPNITSVPNETQTKSSSKAKTVIPTERPHTKAVPKSTHRMPINLIKLHIFEDPKMSFVPNETQKSSFKPTSPTAEIAKAVPKSTHRMPINLIKLHIFEDPKMSFVPNETQKSSFKPTSPSAEIAKAASKELDTDSIEPNLSVPRQKLGTTLAPKKVHSSSSRPKTSVRLRTRPSNYVPNRTTQGTARPKSSNWRSETSIGSSQPGTPRAPLPPARPTHMRRRPFYMYNVTGRPGISGNGLVPRARSSSIRHVPQTTRVSIVERTQTPRLKTTSAPEQETVTEPIFNPGPVSELDPMGKPRYTAPHVKYMRKEDLVPCSITESMKHFPNELATNVDEATVRPQNSPSNLTVIAVEGCPSFVILDWKEPDNDTVTEYKVISKENGGTSGKDQSILTTNQTHSTVENLKPNTSYEFKVVAANVLGEGPPSTTVTHNTESVDPRVSEPITGGKDAIWTEIKFKSDTYSECKGKQYIKRTWYKKFVGIQLCNSLRYKIYLSDSLGGKFYNIGDESGYGEDHCQFVDSFLDGRTGQRLLPDQLPPREGFYRSVRQQPVEFGKIGSQTHIRYVQWYECGTTIPGKW
ncbi:target of Nesh-SH3 isoform X3 [Pleurodeles waltl]|uniref:target of Nesh-SH3 isoform X3 n=1 Tax=Pleurodeles waltl TaxID=8319 RepID=UPI00370952F7